MAAHSKQPAEIKNPVLLQMSQSLKTFCIVSIVLGVLVFAAGMMKNPERAWHAYLIGFFFTVSIALGGLFFTAIQHVVKAGWSVNIRRLAESFTAYLPLGLVAAVGLLVAGKILYPWMDAKHVAEDLLLQKKASYLNQPFFIIRLILFFGLWIFLSKMVVGRSLKQDETGDKKLTDQLLPWSIATVMIFALSYSLFSVDAIMSLEPHWFSTIFGVYCFAGLFQSTIAFMILTSVYLIRGGYLNQFVNENHLHDLGKFLFAFTVFWAYIAFSQFMLIWYANIPEETLFYIPRLQGEWKWVSASLLVFKFVVPFLILLPRSAKRRTSTLVAMSLLILTMQFVDLYWLIYPNLDEETPQFGFYEVFIFAAFIGAFVYRVANFLSKNSVIVTKDPRQHESMSHHVTY